jgi:hypothetical protein
VKLSQTPRRVILLSNLVLSIFLNFNFNLKDSINEVQRDTAIDSRFDNEDEDDEFETPPPKPKKVNGRRNRPVSFYFF